MTHVALQKRLAPAATMTLISNVPQQHTMHLSHQRHSQTMDNFFSSPRLSPSNRDGPDPADVGRSLNLLTSRLPFLLKEGSLPVEILSESIKLELLPSTLGLPEIQGRSTYLAISKLGAWSIGTLFPRAELVIDSQKLIGSARRCERLVARFRLIDANKVLYTGLFHFYFDSEGKISKHVLEVVDSKFHPSSLVNWLVGNSKLEKNLGYCYESYERNSK